ncbi:MAG TPA: ABC transporter permease subunit, partial [Terrimicrobiaceae bacterium]
MPVLGFMPGLVLALVTLFPKSNFGLELACVLMIFTAQVWNMVFSYFDSLRAIPDDFRQMGVLCGFGPVQRFWRIELPFAAQGLIYNCMVSMAGGWFFLTINEAFTLGDKNFQLPGLGSYMSVAIAEGNVPAQIAAVGAMGVMIVAVDRLIWWPLVIWSRRFKIEDIASGPLETTLVERMFAASRLSQALAVVTHLQRAATNVVSRLKPRAAAHNSRQAPMSKRSFKAVYWVILTAICVIGAYGLYGLSLLIAQVDLHEWSLILASTAATFLRVFATLVLGSLWTIPIGVWIGLNPRISRYLQPAIQFAASFPAPMLYPIVLGWILVIGGNLGWGS